MKEYKGRLIVQHPWQIAIAVARFNDLITKNLLNGALECLERYGISDKYITVAWAPGSYELPFIAQELACTKNYDAIICLGAVIRGATAHFDYIAGQASAGIQKVSLDHHLPVIFGILTTDTIEQAIERAGTKAGNKGWEAVQTAIETLDLLHQIKLDGKRKSMAK